MNFVSSRTPGGSPQRCPVCGEAFQMEPSQPFGDAPCPACGSLLWFLADGSSFLWFERGAEEAKRERLRASVAELLGVPIGKIPDDLDEIARIFVGSGADSLDMVELLMEQMELDEDDADACQDL
jgi:acyl carrier protein